MKLIEGWMLRIHSLLRQLLFQSLSCRTSSITCHKMSHWKWILPSTKKRLLRTLHKQAEGVCPAGWQGCPTRPKHATCLPERERWWFTNTGKKRGQGREEKNEYIRKKINSRCPLNGSYERCPWSFFSLSFWTLEYRCIFIYICKRAPASSFLSSNTIKRQWCCHLH